MILSDEGRVSSDEFIRLSIHHSTLDTRYASRMKIFVTFGLSLLLHVLLGWGFTLGAGVVGGFWAVRRGWLVGTLGVGLGWLALLLYNAVVAPEALERMTTTMGGLLGNLPGSVVVGLTLLIGLLLGGLGGAIGTQAARWLRPDEGARAAT